MRKKSNILLTFLCAYKSYNIYLFLFRLMNNFRLIAIIPLMGCSENFSKNLTLGTRFQFYNNYSILLDARKERILKATVTQQKKEVKNLYKLNNGIRVDFSAVVGKNGTGKSTLFELFYYVIYLMGTRSWQSREPFLEKGHGHMEYQKGLMTADYDKLTEAISIMESSGIDKIERAQEKYFGMDIFKIIQKYDLTIDPSRADSMIGVYRIARGNLGNKISDLDYQIRKEKDREILLDEQFNVSVIYESDGKIKELSCRNGKIEHYRFNKLKGGAKVPDEDFSLEYFFYTVSLNYSHHSLNSRNLGLWINRLFHKNDAYITPVVINPMRKDGNFDINDEIKLSRERLASTLAYDLIHGSRNLLLGRYEVTKYIFIPKLMPESEEIGTLMKALLLEKTGTAEVAENVPYKNLALSYLRRKILKTYENYNFLLTEIQGEKIGFEEFILYHDSHLTRKITQTVNYLKVSNSKAHNRIWGQTGGEGIIELTPEQLREYLGLFGDVNTFSTEEIIKSALPGFFNIDFEFEHKVKLSELSSGEQQSIFNMNSILYHLYNIQSVHPDPIDEPINAVEEIMKPDRTAYQNVNIVLDEVELYYHPEMQRELVNNLMQSFEKLKPASGIKGINVCILTHSPFILSDIPTANVLSLERQSDGYSTRKEKQEESFAANINDLLEDKFFLEGTLVGEYAAKKIEKLIEKIEERTLTAEDARLIELIGDPYLKTGLITFKEQYD